MASSIVLQSASPPFTARPLLVAAIGSASLCAISTVAYLALTSCGVLVGLMASIVAYSCIGVVILSVVSGGGYILYILHKREVEYARDKEQRH
jgi:hypothetical protein